MKCNTERGEKPYQYISKTTGQHNVISQTLLKSSASPHPPHTETAAYSDQCCISANH